METDDVTEKTAPPFRRRTGSSVLVIYTGGTIGMIADPENGNALKPSVSFIRQELENIAKYESEEFPSIEVSECDEIIDSSDMNVEWWIKIAQMIQENYYQYDGFVVIMGTDTMAYTASALSFLFTNLAKSVILTGAMIPLFKGYSDARRNLLISIEIAASSNIPEVCVFFHDRLVRGNRSKKMKNNALDAFNSPQYPPLATFGTSLNINEAIVFPHPRKAFSVVNKMDPSVVVIRLIPGFASSALECLLKHCRQMKGLVLELYGNGNLPMKEGELLTWLSNAIDQGLVIAVCSQCIFGEVDLSAYEVGKVLADIGAVSTLDMTIEAVCTKMAFLFGQGHDPQTVRTLLLKNLRGELKETS